jgi:hypothetical protein
MLQKLILVPLVLLLASCALVKLTPEGDNVAVLQPNEVTNCSAEGSITVAVVSKFVVEREAAKVQQELRTLARNRAAGRGDTLVAAGPAADGQQTFNIYRCRR